MGYMSPSKFVLFIIIFGVVPLFFLIGVVSVNDVCGVSGLATTEKGEQNIDCSCVGVTKKIGGINKNKTYCTGLNFSNNDLNRVIRLSRKSDVELQFLDMK